MVKILEQIGKDLTEIHEDLRFDGIQYGIHHIPHRCHFTCLRTGASFLIDSPSDVQNKLEFIRETFPHLN